ncbi:MAG: hypothetical protein EB075_15420, partial [Bacteroidetes bacterium]|nr:hypothetical protein [Bacteroidota bacterium]
MQGKNDYKRQDRGLIVQQSTRGTVKRGRAMEATLRAVLLTLFVIKVRDPLEMLEPLGRSPKRVRLLYRG